MQPGQPARQGDATQRPLVSGTNSRTVLFVLGAVTIAAVLAAAEHLRMVDVPSAILVASRWIVIASLVGYAL
ncbi:MAG TPA: hypothetical protein VMT45_02995, partial [Thermoanaerobaculaceae bacterium]|nr:hypothetical protein [Thermoanaerobaculaceae bacterium]